RLGALPRGARARRADRAARALLAPGRRGRAQPGQVPVPPLHERVRAARRDRGALLRRARRRRTVRLGGDGVRAARAARARGRARAPDRPPRARDRGRAPLADRARAAGGPRRLPRRARPRRQPGRRDVLALLQPAGQRRRVASLAAHERTFYSAEVRIEYREEPCRTALNRVRGMPFAWSLNPYMGCAHRCSFCYVRAFELRAERPPDDRYGRSIRVKTNVAEVLRRELARPSWR